MKMLQLIKHVYEDDALGCSAVFKWHQRFSQGRDSLEDDQRMGWSPTDRTERKIEEVATVVRANCSQSIEDIAAEVVVSHGTCHKILTDDLKMSRVTQQRVPRILTQDQHDDRMTICGDLISTADQDRTILKCIITGDETWCFLYDPTLKRQSHLEIAGISKRENPETRQVKSKVMQELF